MSTSESDLEGWTSDSDSDSLPLYDGPECHVCCDLLPNDPEKRVKGKWVDVLEQGVTKLSLKVEFSDVYQAAETCNDCALVIEALECFEGPTPTLNSNYKLQIETELCTPLRLSYQILNEDATPRHIEVFSDTESETLTAYGCIGRAGWIEPEITPQKAARIAQSWLCECIDFHKECMVGKRHSFIPTRVVYVGTASRPPRLIETTEDMKAADYIALSYCWGSAETLMTTKATLQNRLSGIEWKDIPKTLYEAIEFVQHLGLSYIWIDALCIIQDDVQDWEKQAAQIKEVYEGALFTLSATSAPDVGTGCFLARITEVRELHSAKPQHKYYARRSCIGTHNAKSASMTPVSF